MNRKDLTRVGRLLHNMHGLPVHPVAHPMANLPLRVHHLYRKVPGRFSGDRVGPVLRMCVCGGDSGGGRQRAGVRRGVDIRGVAYSGKWSAQAAFLESTVRRLQDADAGTWPRLPWTLHPTYLRCMLALFYRLSM